MPERLDKEMARRGLVSTRSQADSFIKLGRVKLNGQVEPRSSKLVGEKDMIELVGTEKYVSRAGLKLASVAQIFRLDFNNKTVLDVGSSTGGFTDYALQHGASKVIAVDVGTDQMHPSLRSNPKVELHEKTDIRDFQGAKGDPKKNEAKSIDIIVIDVSFISLRDILPHIANNLSNENTQIIAMLKPQFEAGRDQINKGVIKNDSIRRQILHEFETWLKGKFIIKAKRDSEVAGAKGNLERFYFLSII